MAVHHSGRGEERKDEKLLGISSPREVVPDAGSMGTGMSGTTQASGFSLIMCAQMVGVLMHMS